jgi:hypothetical protein
MDKKLEEVAYSVSANTTMITDGHFGYENVYGKKASRKKSRFTNIVENLNY